MSEDRWDDKPRPPRVVIPIKELRARRHAKTFLNETFPYMKPATVKLFSEVLGIMMATPRKKEKP